MKEYSDFKGRDIRAVENPYEAAFELAGTAGAFSKRTVLWLSVLMFFFIFYIALTLYVVYLNLYVFNRSDLRFLGIAMACVNIGMGQLSLWWIALSMRSFRLIGQSHGLLLKLGTANPGMAQDTAGTGVMSGARPQMALNGLIEATISDSSRLLSTFRYVYLFIALWMVNAVVYFAIQSIRFGPNILAWTLDWIGPGGFGADAFLFLLVSTIAYLKARDRFDFLKTRYQAIEYAMNRPRASVPAGENPLERYKAFLATQSDIRGGSAWTSGAYLSGTLKTQSGTVLVKALDAAPDPEALAEFVRHARAHGESVSRAVILYPEDPDKTLSEAVYNEVVNNPVRVGNELFTVELVMEGRDGFYDLVPVVSP